MSEFSFRGLTYMVLIAFLVWSSNFEACIARRGKHWRQNRDVSASSLYKKKGKSHGNKHSNHHGRGGGSHSKPKPPSPKAPPHYKITPSPSASPPPPIPNPKKGSPSASPPKGYNVGHSNTFNVLDFGAKGDGKTDDTKAFESAWTAACKVQSSTMLIPADYVFFVGPISFSGPYCKPNIVFQVTRVTFNGKHSQKVKKAVGTGLTYM